MAFTGGPIYILSKNPNAVTQVGTAEKPAVSRTLVDEPNYDNGNYRDEFLPQVVDDVNAILANSSGLKLNDTIGTNESYLTKTSEAGAITVATIPPLHMAIDDKVLHIAPRNEVKKRTIMKFWSAAGGTGDQLGEIWADKFIQWTGFQPTRF